jgi:rSAM/selenodomain-associated transferase 2
VRPNLSPTLSVIIPTLNEADHLPALLDDLARQKNISCEILIGDGGSTDATRSIAQSFGALFIAARRGRGVQMNTAARQARGDYLLFLHADSRIDDPCLLEGALRALRVASPAHSRVAGHFRLRFMRSTRRNTVAYRYMEEKTGLNRVNTTNGDQGLLLATVFFRQLGEFDESLPFLEDQRIAEKIRVAGQWITLPGCLHTSARRFEAEGLHRRYLLMGMMMGLYSIGEHSFFLRAPEVYRVQQETGTLLLSPFFGLIGRMICKEWGLKGSIRVFYALGRYIRENSWQLFFFLDVCLRPLLGTGRYPCLRFHDRVLAPCIRFRWCNALVGLCCFVWYMGILAPFFRLAEYGRSSAGQGRGQHEHTK